MHQTLCMRGGQARGRLHPDPEYLLELQRSDAVEPLLQRLSADQRHHQVRQSAGAVDGVNRHHVFVRYGGGGPRFAGKPSPGGGAGGQLRRQQLDGHVAIQ